MGRRDNLLVAATPSQGVSNALCMPCRLPWVLAQGELLVSVATPTFPRACFVCLLLTVWLQLDGDLFLMPSFGGGTTTSEGGDTDAQGGPFSKRSSRGTGSGSHQQQQEEVYGGAGLMQQDW